MYQLVLSVDVLNIQARKRFFLGFQWRFRSCSIPFSLDRAPNRTFAGKSESLVMRIPGIRCDSNASGLGKKGSAPFSVG